MASLPRRAARAVQRLLSQGDGDRLPTSAVVSIKDPVAGELLELSELRLLGLSKCGLPSWRGRLGEQPVKIYRCHDTGQAELVERISADQRLRRFFPACHLRLGSHLIVDWVEGESPTWASMGPGSALFGEVASLQRELHDRRTDDLPRGGFSYPGYLERRWREWAGVWPIDDVLASLLEEIGDTTVTSPARLSHADVTAANLVLERESGQLKVIDNELLSLNPMPRLDLLNTYRSFGSRLRDRYTEGYLSAYHEAGGDLTAMAAERNTLEAAWLLRSIGALLQAGAIDAALELADDRRRGRQPAHPLLAGAARFQSTGEPS